jgi:hydrogenase large subunit
VPTDYSSLAALPPGVGLACFPREPITVVARLVSCNCDVDGSWYMPSWFFLGSGGPNLLVEPSATDPVISMNPDDWFALNLDPNGQNPDVLPIGEVVEVTGIFDHPDAYDATYANAGAWGDRRWATPGVIVDGELVTTDLHKLNIGVEEFVDHSYYEDWSGSGQRQRFPTDPAGNPLSPYHPWNKVTKPRPQGQNWKEKYTWDTTPRWDRQSMEAGAYARLWNTAVARKLPANSFIESTGTSLKMRLPKGALPEMEIEWHVPEVWNAFERNRGRAYCTAFTALVALNNWVAAMDRLKLGDTRTSTPFEIPKRGEQLGVGFWGAGRGYLTHHLVLDRGAVANYQIVTPSTWNASPTDRWQQPGPYEEAVLNTPLLEETDDPKQFKGIDILRAIRSFDPCMPCTTHIHSDAGVITREVNTCACGVDDDGA